MQLASNICDILIRLRTQGRGNNSLSCLSIHSKIFMHIRFLFYYINVWIFKYLIKFLSSSAFSFLILFSVAAPIRIRLSSSSQSLIILPHCNILHGYKQLVGILVRRNDHPLRACYCRAFCRGNRDEERREAGVCYASSGWKWRMVGPWTLGAIGMIRGENGSIARRTSRGIQHLLLVSCFPKQEPSISSVRLIFGWS